MMKALENPDFKKIWEYVNWQVRHPGAKSLEEALRLERKHFDCMFVYNDIYSYVGECGENLLSHKSGYDGMINEEMQELKYVSDKIKLCERITGVTILGRPITLADIFYIYSLPKLPAPETAGMHYNQNGWHLVLRFNHCCYSYTDIDWHLLKDLHEQSDETWTNLSLSIKTR